jgi:hypothetical protein
MYVCLTLSCKKSRQEEEKENVVCHDVKSHNEKK